MYQYVGTENTNKLTSSVVLCPAVLLPVSACSKAEICAALTQATPGDCIPSEPHPRIRPIGARDYTHPVHAITTVHIYGQNVATYLSSVTE